MKSASHYLVKTEKSVQWDICVNCILLQARHAEFSPFDDVLEIIKLCNDGGGKYEYQYTVTMNMTKSTLLFVA